MTTRDQSILLVILAVIVGGGWLATASKNEREKDARAIERLEVRDVTQIIRGDNVRVSGRVFNAGTVAVRFIRVELRMFDGAGNVIGKEGRYVGSSDLLPGESNDFEIAKRLQRDLSRIDVRVIEALPAEPR